MRCPERAAAQDKFISMLRFPSAGVIATRKFLWDCWLVAAPLSSLPGLTRQSILFVRVLRRVMDTRVEPAYDAAYVAACCENFSIHISNSHGFTFPRRRASLSF
jgi:hypothetical protein